MARPKKVEAKKIEVVVEEVESSAAIMPVVNEPTVNNLIADKLPSLNDPGQS